MKRIFTIGLAISLAVAWLLAPFAAGGQELARAFRKGERITITGRLLAPDDRPLAGVTVLLELRRTTSTLLGLKPKTEEPVQIPSTTGPGGEISIGWSFDPFYDSIGLAVALPVQREGREDFEIFERRDITPAIAQGLSPVAVDLVLERPGYLEWLRLYLEGKASTDEVKVFREQGRPDRVDRELRRGGVVEMGWWYFAKGQCYRFKNGRLDQVIPFEPLSPP